VHTEWAKKATVQEPPLHLQGYPKLKKLMHQLMLQETDLDYTENTHLAWPLMHKNWNCSHVETKPICT